MGFELGQRVTWSRADELYRHKTFEYGQDPTREWLSPRDRLGSTARFIQDEQRSGVVVGVRTLTNGTAKRYWEEPTEYTVKEAFKAVVLAWDLKRKPVYVRLEDVKEA